jgi:hypothetical protein
VEKNIDFSLLKVNLGSSITTSHSIRSLKSILLLTDLYNMTGLTALVATLGVLLDNDRPLLDQFLALILPLLVLCRRAPSVRSVVARGCSWV